MTRRTKDDWKKLIKEQSASQLSIANFCKDHELGQSYFYKIKNELMKPTDLPQKTAFLKVSKSTVNSTQSQSITIDHQQIRISLPVTISSLWLAEFIQGLA